LNRLVIGGKIANEGPVLRNQNRSEVADAGQSDVAEFGDRREQKVAGFCHRAWRLRWIAGPDTCIAVECGRRRAIRLKCFPVRLVGFEYEWLPRRRDRQARIRHPALPAQGRPHQRDECTPGIVVEISDRIAWKRRRKADVVRDQRGRGRSEVGRRDLYRHGRWAWRLRQGGQGCRYRQQCEGRDDARPYR
jgi:hypothetical protein